MKILASDVNIASRHALIQQEEREESLEVTIGRRGKGSRATRGTAQPAADRLSLSGRTPPAAATKHHDPADSMAVEDGADGDDLAIST